MVQTKTYKQLYLKFAWQLCLFLLTVCIAASVFQAFETNRDKTEPRIRKEDVISNFSSVFNISANEIDKLVKDINNIRPRDHKNKKMTFLEALVLAMSLFYTIGWGHVLPVTGGGKIFAVLISCVGIPLTFIMLITGGNMFTRHVFDLIRITHNHNPSKSNKYSENQINTISKKLLTPVMVIILLLYVIITAKLLSIFEGFAYGDALWYTFITLTTIGLDDVTQQRVIGEEEFGKQIGLTLFVLFWILFGMLMMAGTIISILSVKKQVSIKKHRHQQLRTSPERNLDAKLLHNMDDSYEKL